MNLLLDTHTLLWALLDDPKLPPEAGYAIETAETVFVSAVSIWEITNKYQRGKLPEVGFFVHRLEMVVVERKMAGLPISLDHAGRAATLPDIHRDPWDRLLIAQAMSEDLMLVSNETIFDAYGVHRLW